MRRKGPAAIRTETEYRRALRDLEQMRRNVEEHRAALQRQGLGEGAIRRLMTPMIASQSQLEAEIAEYERASTNIP